MAEVLKNNTIKALFLFMMLFIGLNTCDALEKQSISIGKEVENVIQLQPQILRHVITEETDGGGGGGTSESDELKTGGVDCEALISGDTKAFLNKILGYIKIFGPILVVVLGSVDFLRATVSQDADALKKSGNKFFKRLLAAALLFIFPALIQFLLDIVKIDGVTYCQIK
ncbi:MAG: hypothetical protein PHD10_00755 [Bacilli bacterium]|nr:hypothetical protein [Bacilli bacterium]MDD4607651.1 hypothetical protein [Bacilli bacterium]